MMKLYGEPGWGSAIVEAQLEWYGLPYEFESVGNIFKSAEARQQLTDVNPIAQVPTLVLEDGTVMTESAAITLLLAESNRDDSLVPSPGTCALRTRRRCCGSPRGRPQLPRIAADRRRT
jgi:GST-like protein